jgi:hypothetical protein
MIHVQGEDTDSPTVDYDAGTATVTCDVCHTTRENWPLRLMLKLAGGYVLSTNGLCSCQYTTTYSLNGPESIIKIFATVTGLPQPDDMPTPQLPQ